MYFQTVFCVTKKGVMRLTVDTEDGDYLLPGLLASDEVPGASPTDIETFIPITLSRYESPARVLTTLHHPQICRP